MNIAERTKKILGALEHTSEDLLALSDDIWINIDHNNDEALLAGAEFKRGYNAAMADFAQVAERIREIVENYTRENLPEPSPEPRVVEPLDPSALYPIDTDFSYLRPIGFKFRDHRVLGVNTWRKVYEAFCRYLATQHTNFATVVSSDAFLTPRGNRYFAASPDGLRTPTEVIPGVFAEVHFSANNMRDRMRDLLSFFGHGPTDLHFFLREDRDA